MAIPQTVKKAQQKLGFKKVVLLYSNNNDQMVGESQIYQKVFADAGIEVVDTETFADKDTDFSAQLTKIQAANPDVIAVAGLYQEGALIAKKFRDTLAQIKNFEGATGKFSFDDHRDPSMDLDVLVIKDGKWTPLQ